MPKKSILCSYGHLIAEFVIDGWMNSVEQLIMIHAREKNKTIQDNWETSEQGNH
jgi:hypothetical protein